MFPIDFYINLVGTLIFSSKINILINYVTTEFEVITDILSIFNYMRIFGI